jgi:hypothetical protein
MYDSQNLYIHSNGIVSFLLFAMAYYFHERISHGKTILRYREKMALIRETNASLAKQETQQVDTGKADPISDKLGSGSRL